MNEKEILEQQVEALEKLLQLRSAIIQELEANVSKLQAEKASYPYGGVNVPGWITTPYIQPLQPMPYVPWQGGGGGGSGTITITSTCPDGTPHEYPSMWGGTSSPPCNKCGQTGLNLSGISATCQSNLPGASNIVATSGYIAPVTSQTLSMDGISQTITHGNVFTLTNAAK